MASTPLTLILFITLSSFLLHLSPQAQAQAPAPSPSGPLNLTAILEKGGQFTTLIRLLQDTQQLTQIQSQLKSNSQGFTLFAPTDNAFQNLKSGAINDLTDEQKVQLILYHVTPKYYSLSDLLTVSNPVRTQASGSDGSWGLNFTGQGNQVNVSSGVVETPINNALREKFPLAVYQVDKVLLPMELFGAKSPSSAPSPKSSKTTPEIPSTAKASGAPSPSGGSQNDNGVAERNVGVGVIFGLGLICMGVLS
ncbi:fasciclin-like arabinogalactan protein 13 [Abrus precatorius]|uniref:Fasciclin-like arabinogalactan protein 13 n=1 Tax=Abrus precatorius TaxID=3816 RepID=A0A8B8KG32_ABRPR|nr:fasciclin-like arabinogalactan protein 13 [Abrus precatorius]